MDLRVDDPSTAISRSSNSYNLMNGVNLNNSACLEIRLFYVRIAPCVIDCLPDGLKLRHHSPEIGVSMEINGSRVPATDAASLILRRDRVDKEGSEVTYVSTDSVRVTGGIEFEVCENDEIILCGSLERLESTRSDDLRIGWAMDCYMVAAISSGSSAFFQPKLGVSSPAIEVYIAGCCSGVPVILTKTIQMSPRRRVSRHGMLDSIPEGEETEKEERSGNGLGLGKLQITEPEVDDNGLDGKIIRHGYYSEDMFPGEDGELSWFNAGVRVGVGISLGMCIGVGIGVGLLMRSYQTTTRNFRRRFF